MISTTMWPPIPKEPATHCRLPNMPDYERSRAQFSWAKARADLDGLPHGAGLNTRTRPSTVTCPPASASAARSAGCAATAASRS